MTKLNKVKIYVMIIITCLCLFSAFGCTKTNENKSENENQNQVVESLLISESVVNLQVYEDGKLTVVNEEGSISWVSSNNEVVEIDANGYYLAKKKGIAYITATYEDKVGKCKIIVENSNFRPTICLGIGTNSLSLLVGDEFVFEPYILYNGKRYYDAKFTYNNLQDLIEIYDKKIKANKTGSVVVDVNASWHGYIGLLSTDLSINVVADNYIQIDKRIIDLQTSSYLGKDTSTTITAKVFVNGQETSKAVSWEFVGENNDCIEFNNGKITSKKEGQAMLVAKAILDDEEIITSPTIIINVEQTVVNNNTIQNIDYDNAILDFGLPTNYVVEKLFDEENQITFESNGSFTPYKMGERTIKANVKDAENREIIFNYKVKIVKQIKTAQELVSISTSYGNNPTAENNYTYYGYFELANNIDATGYIIKNYVNADYNEANSNGGFVGVFDGKGYTIDNLSAYVDEGFTYGVFGQIGYESVIKNVAFTNLKGTFLTNINYECASLAYYSFGQVENVLIQTNDEFMSSVRFSGNGAKFKNFVVLAPNYFAQYIEDYDCKVASAVSYSDLVGHNVVVDSDSVITISQEEYPNREYKAFNINTFKTQISSYDPTEYFTNDIWVAESGKVPYFKSMVSTSVDAVKGDSINLKDMDSNGIFELVNSYNNVSLNNGVLIVSNDFEGKDVKVRVTNNVFEYEYIITFNVVGIYIEDVIYDLNGENGISLSLDNIDSVENVTINNIVISKANYSYSSNILSIARSVIDNLDLAYGDYVMTIATTEEMYIAKFIVATKVIYSANDLINLQSKYGNNATESNHYQYDGYFILNNNINAAGYTWNSFVKTDEQDPVNCGFKGIFDGRGYTIMNLQSLASNSICYGVFGGLAEGSIVRNVAFVGVQGNPSNNINHNTSILAYYNSGSIENVYIETNNAFVSTFRYQGNASYKNLVVVAPELFAPYLEYYDCKVGSALAYSDLTAAKPNIDFNTVITVSGDEYNTQEEHRTWLALNSKTYLTDISNIQFNEYFDEAIWNTEKGKIPYFKTYNKTEQGIEWDEQWSNKN